MRRGEVRLPHPALSRCVGLPPECDLQPQPALVAATVLPILPFLIAPPALGDLYQSRQRNPAHDHLCLSRAAEPNPPVCRMYNAGRDRPTSRLRLAKADAAIPPMQTGCKTSPALDSVLRHSI